MDESKLFGSLILSRLELMFTSAVLQSPMLGIEMGNVSPEQHELILLQGERSLRLRDRVKRNAEGALDIEPILLNAVATCVYPQRSFSIYHSRNDGVVMQGFAHQHKQRNILHIAINPELHSLHECASSDDLVQRVFDLINYHADATAANFNLDISQATLAQARDLAEKQQSDQALQTLTETGVKSADAATLVDMLSGTFATTVFVVLHYQRTSVKKYELTLLHAKNHVGLMTQNADKHQYHLRGITQAEFKQVLLEVFEKE